MIEEAELAARNARSLANSVLTILLHGIAALQSDRHTAASLRAAAVLRPAAHGLTGQVATVRLETVLTVPVVTAPQVIVLIDPAATGRVVTAHIPAEQIAQLAQNPDLPIGQATTVLTDPVVIAQVAIDLTDPVETAPEVTGLTVLAVNDPLVTARIHQEPIIRLALNPDPPIVLAVTVPVVIDLIDPPVTDPLVTAHIHQEPIVRLAQKPSVLIGQAVTDPVATGLTDPVLTALAATENLMLKEKAHPLHPPAITRKVLPPHPDQEAAGLIHPTGAHPAGTQAKVLQGQARIGLRYPSNAPSPRSING